MNARPKFPSRRFPILDDGAQSVGEISHDAVDAGVNHRAHFLGEFTVQVTTCKSARCACSTSSGVTVDERGHSCRAPTSRTVCTESGLASSTSSPIMIDAIEPTDRRESRRIE